MEDEPTIRAIARVVNALPLAEPPGRETRCPDISAEPEAKVRLTFRGASGGPDVARVLVDSDDCGRGGAALGHRLQVR